MTIRVCLILCLSLITWTGEGQAQDLETMFQKWGVMSAVTEPGAYEAQTRGYAVGGRLTLKAANEDMTLFTAKLPSIKAGCEGIDIFGGAFSWVNLTQFTKNLKAIGQNALGYAFSLGLEAVCPVCMQKLQVLQNFMNQINKMTSDSCLAAKTLVNGGYAALTDMSMKGCKETTEDYVDQVAGWLDCAGKQESEVRANIRQKWGDFTNWQLDTKPKSSKMGVNVTTQSLVGQGLTADELQLAVSILGTVNLENKDKTNTDSLTDPVCTPYDKTLTLSQLMEGGTVKLWQCNGDHGTYFQDGYACKNLTPTEVSMEGFRAKVKKMMTSIYEKLLLPANQRALSTDEQTFIKRTATVDVYLALNSLAKMGTAYESVALASIDVYSQAIALDYAWQIIEVFMRKSTLGASNISSDCEVEKKGLKEILTKVQADRIAEMEKLEQSMATYQRMNAWYEQLNKNMVHAATRVISNVTGTK